jgi:hypothetical protein
MKPGQTLCEHCSAGVDRTYEWPSVEIRVCSGCALSFYARGLSPLPDCRSAASAPDECMGPVTYQHSENGTGALIPRCKRHHKVTANGRHALSDDKD